MNDQREEQSQEPTNPESRAREVTFRPDYATAFPTYYANFAFVNHTPHDMNIEFSLIAPPHRIDESQGIVSLPVVTRVTIPLGLVQGLINALTIQLTAQHQEQEQGRVAVTGSRMEDPRDG